MNKKQTIYLSLGILFFIVIYIIGGAKTDTTLSTVSFPDLTSAQCTAKNNLCVDNNGLTGKFLDCHIGSEKRCYCEFRSYANQLAIDKACGTNTPIPVGTASGSGVVITQPTKPATTTISGEEVKWGDINTLIIVILVSLLIVYFIKRRGF